MDFEPSAQLKRVSAGGSEGCPFAEVISGCILAWFWEFCWRQQSCKMPLGGLAIIQEAGAALLACLAPSKADPRVLTAEKDNLFISVHWPGGPFGPGISS